MLHRPSENEPYPLRSTPAACALHALAKQMIGCSGGLLSSPPLCVSDICHGWDQPCLDIVRDVAGSPPVELLIVLGKLLVGEAVRHDSVL